MTFTFQLYLFDFSYRKCACREREREEEIFCLHHSFVFMVLRFTIKRNVARRREQKRRKKSSKRTNKKKKKKKKHTHERTLPNRIKNETYTFGLVHLNDEAKKIIVF